METVWGAREMRMSRPMLKDAKRPESFRLLEKLGIERADAL